MHASISSPASAAEVAATTTSAPQALPILFHGKTRDYFRIWIVNVSLAVVTLGIWSAWAKIRTLRWFYGHTEINGHSFDYHANGKQILFGRLLALAVIVGATIFSLLSSVTELIAYAAILIVIPWAINSGLRFNATMTSWCNVRFGFQGSYFRAACAFLLMPLASLLSFGLLAPYSSRMMGRYIAGGHCYGTAQFDSTPRLSKLYVALGSSFLVFISMMALSLLVGSMYANVKDIEWSMQALTHDWHLASHHNPSQPPPSTDTLTLFVLVLALGFYIAILAASQYYRACLRNELLNQLTVRGGHRLKSRLSPLRYMWIVLSGVLATALTLTLAYPWARVRCYRYLTHSVVLLAAPGLHEMVSRQEKVPGSFGGEFSELEGFGSTAAL
ncbi:hypothetical protein CE206_28590 (plasmid) [Achromobacter xylosoxidans]|uniref:YjgN family protein n=1 Tax=Alcaligenes xylosoxydans xylosoxydans TaxID=85698 RepID=UPI000DD10630|nr:YjgN family protein [Achromobacter xylosoxidans]AXA80542.1 hypothetical protein CE206_28590 [Achromobacter xylosoxidans]